MSTPYPSWRWSVPTAVSLVVLLGALMTTVFAQRAGITSDAGVPEARELAVGHESQMDSVISSGAIEVNSMRAIGLPAHSLGMPMSIDVAEETEETADAPMAMPNADRAAAVLTGECDSGGCNNFSNNYPSGTFSTACGSFVTVESDIFGGEYAYYNVTAGATYEWSLCAADGGSASYDSQLSLWNQAGTTAFCYSDDFCGLQSKIRWTAPSSQTVRVLVSQYNCASNSVGATLRWQCASTMTVDLAATQVYFRDQAGNAGNIVNTPTVGQPVYAHFDYQVSNGTAVGDIWTLYLDGAVLCGPLNGTRSPNSYTGWCASPWTATGGMHALLGRVDPGFAIPESNENNNDATKNFAVGSPDILVTPSDLDFSCTGSRIEPGSYLAADEADVFGLAAAVPQSAKLIDPEKRIAAGFAGGESRMMIAVGLVDAAGMRAKTNWNDVLSTGQLRRDVAKVQQAVLSRFTDDELRVQHRYENLFGFSASVTEAGVQKLLADPAVKFIQPVLILEPHSAQGIPVMNALATRSIHNGAGMSIAICDTGIDYNHPQLGGGGFPNSKVIGGTDTGQMDADPTPQPFEPSATAHAHGTACAGIAAGDVVTVGNYIGGVAPGAKLYSLKISGATGSSTDVSIAAAWDWCVTHKNDHPAFPIMVISTSFGGGRFFGPCDGASLLASAAAANAVASGITVFASSGNDGFCDSMGFPACVSSVISVGAVYDANIGSNPPSGFVGCIDSGSCVGFSAGCPCPDRCYSDVTTNADQVTTYSNSDDILTLLAPSEDASTADIVGALGYSAGNYTGFGGTSAACPYAAGAAAAFQSAAKAITGNFLTPPEVRSILVTTGMPILDPKSSITKPRINLGSAINSLGLPSCSGEALVIENTGAVTLNISAVSTPPWAQVSPPPPYNVINGQALQLCVTVDCGACVPPGLNGILGMVSDDPDESPFHVPIWAACGGCTGAADCAGCETCQNGACMPVSCGTCMQCDNNHGCAPVVCPSDGIFCNGVEVCQSDVCIHPGNPCPAGQTCSNPGQTCVDCDIIVSNLPDCAIDAGQPHSMTAQNPPQGPVQMPLTFNQTCPIAGLTPADFGVSFTPGPAPAGFAITQVTISGATATLQFNRSLPAGQWTCITHLASGEMVCNGLLPGDSDGNRTSNSSDIQGLIGRLLVPPTNSLPAFATDLDRSGVTNSFDVVHAVNIMNGAGMFDPWLGAMLPPCPGAIPPGMALIPGGEFLMGDPFNEGDSDELPRHAVYVDAFYMDRNEVTNQQYADALNWAWSQGNLITVTSGVVYKYNSGTSFPYCSTTSAPSSNPDYGQYSQVTWNGSTFGVVAGKESHPMVMVSWWGSAAYANWRSGMEGRTPSYDTSTWLCNFAANGYRLPTEAEWEKAVRGGASGRRFPWSDSDTIQHARGNYNSDAFYSYDTSPTRGYHPTFAIGNVYTSPVGYFAPNGYGLYDMAGNVWEWGNDWGDASYYATSPYSNPHGPSSGTYRVIRGGSWGHLATYSRCAGRSYDLPRYRSGGIGFRLVLDSE